MSRYLQLKITEIINETADAKTIILEEEDGKKLPYKAGQFLTFIFSIAEGEFRRSYSLSSSPETDQHLAISVKRVKYGKISNHIHGKLQVGAVLKALPPTGRFVLPNDYNSTSKDIFLVAAGSGITPIFSIIKTLLQQETEHQITLIYCNRNEASAIFYDTLNQWARTYQNRFRCLHILSAPTGNDYVYHGHLNSFLLEDLIDKNLHFNKDDALVYVCGPHDLMRMVYMKLSLSGFRKENIYREQFVVRDEIKRAPVPLVADKADKTVIIHYQNQEYKLTVPYGKSILQAGLDAHLELPYSCKGGVCSSCTAMCREGKVEMANNEVLTEKDIKQGMILTCTGYPNAKKVVIDYNFSD